MSPGATNQPPNTAAEDRPTTVNVAGGPLTVVDVMDRDFVVVPQQMMVREAARLIHRARAAEAIVVDEHGRCVGMLTAADIFRWIDAGCPDAPVSPALACPYQVRGRLLTGGEAVICVLSHGTCPFQSQQPTTGGRHTDLCMWQGTEAPPFGTVPGFITTEVLAVKPQLPLLEMVRKIIDTRSDRLIVLDEHNRPLGTVTAVGALSAVTAATSPST